MKGSFRGQPRPEPVALNHALASNLQFSGDRYPDFDRLRTELGGWHSYYLDPRTAMRREQAPREIDDIGAQGEYLAPFLFRLKQSPEHAKQFQAIRRALRRAILSIESLDVDLDPRRGTLDLTVTQDGIAWSSRVISEGTLRVLALCAIAAKPWPGTLVAFEEPENGVQPRRIDVIAELLRGMAGRAGRQVVVTTHSPTLVAALAARQQAEPNRIKLLRTLRDGPQTRLVPFQPLRELFDAPHLREALSSPDDDQAVSEMMLRGWFDAL